MRHYHARAINGCCIYRSIFQLYGKKIAELFCRPVFRVIAKNMSLRCQVKSFFNVSWLCVSPVKNANLLCIASWKFTKNFKVKGPRMENDFRWMMKKISPRFIRLYKRIALLCENSGYKKNKEKYANDMSLVCFKSDTFLIPMIISHLFPYHIICSTSRICVTYI